LGKKYNPTKKVSFVQKKLLLTAFLSGSRIYSSPKSMVKEERCIENITYHSCSRRTGSKT